MRTIETMRPRTKRIRFEVLTIFPHIFDSYIGESLFRRAQKKKIVKIVVHNLRDFAVGRHKQVDDSPFGGGPGMVLKIEPIYKAVQFLKRKEKRGKRKMKE